MSWEMRGSRSSIGRFANETYEQHHTRVARRILRSTAATPSQREGARRMLEHASRTRRSR